MEKTKICTHCKVEKPVSAYSKNWRYTDGLYVYCKACRVIINGENRRKHPEVTRAYRRKWHQKNKMKILEHYCENGIKCSRCGFEDVRALTLDHIEGGGNKHRKKINSNLYWWIVRHKFPKGFQILCMNCQFIKKVENNEVPLV